ncbi:putative Mnd1 HTH domain containing protein [Leishmania naiffi]|uniref:Mnd1 HTH domain containing protein n=1 Tax=Leishmania naiffi TaxID=5678 RepID=A0AAW3BR02_9TRYP
MSTTAGARKKGKKGLSIDEKAILVERWIAAHPKPYTLKELQQLIPKHTPVIYQSVEECVQLLVAEGRIEEDRVGVSTLLWKFPPTATQLKNKSSQQPGRNRGLGSNSASSAAASGCPTSCTELLRRLTARGAAAQLQKVSAETIERWCMLTPDAQLREWRDVLRAENDRTMASLAEEQERLGFLDRSDNANQDSEDASAGEAAVLSELAHLQQLAQQKAQLLAAHKNISSRQVLPELLDQLDRASSIALEAANRWTDNYYLAEEEVVAKTSFGGSRRDIRAALQLPQELSYLSDESDAESNVIDGHERPEVDSHSRSHLQCTPAHGAPPQPSLPPQHGSHRCGTGRPPSTQEKQTLITASSGDTAFPAAHANVRGDDLAPAAGAPPSAPDTETTALLSTSAKVKTTQAAKPLSAKRSTGKRARSRRVAL